MRMLSVRRHSSRRRTCFNPVARRHHARTTGHVHCTLTGHHDCHMPLSSRFPRVRVSGACIRADGIIQAPSTLLPPQLAASGVVSVSYCVTPRDSELISFACATCLTPTRSAFAELPSVRRDDGSAVTISWCVTPSYPCARSLISCRPLSFSLIHQPTVTTPLAPSPLVLLACERPPTPSPSSVRRSRRRTTQARARVSRGWPTLDSDGAHAPASVTCEVPHGDCAAALSPFHSKSARPLPDEANPVVQCIFTSSDALCRCKRVRCRRCGTYSCSRNVCAY